MNRRDLLKAALLGTVAAALNPRRALAGPVDSEAMTWRALLGVLDGMPLRGGGWNPVDRWEALEADARLPPPEVLASMPAADLRAMADPWFTMNGDHAAIGLHAEITNGDPDRPPEGARPAPRWRP